MEVSIHEGSLKSGGGYLIRIKVFLSLDWSCLHFLMVLTTIFNKASEDFTGPVNGFLKSF